MPWTTPVAVSPCVRYEYTPVPLNPPCASALLAPLMLSLCSPFRAPQIGNTRDSLTPPSIPLPHSLPHLRPRPTASPAVWRHGRVITCRVMDHLLASTLDGFENWRHCGPRGRHCGDTCAPHRDPRSTPMRREPKRPKGAAVLIIRMR